MVTTGRISSGMPQKCDISAKTVPQMTKHVENKVEIIGGGLAGAEAADYKLLRNKACSDGNNKNVARTTQYISAKTVPQQIACAAASARERSEVPMTE